MKNSQKIYRLENSQEVSKSKFFRLKSKAKKLNCLLMEVPDMRGKHKSHISGESHFRYNKDRIIASNGYVLVRVSKTHPLHNANGYAYEHRIVASKKEGSILTKYDIVHHINNDKTDNRPENLEVTTKEEHNSLHLQLLNNRCKKTGKFLSVINKPLPDVTHWCELPLEPKTT